MERHARARFLVFRVSRWSVALALLAALALLLIPRKGTLPALGGDPSGVVQQGVVMWGRDFSGRTEAEVRQMLVAMAGQVKSTPVAARTARSADGYDYVIPELNGYELDVDMTWMRLSQAAAGGEVEPATRIHTPTKRMSDFPQSVIRQGNASKKAVALLVNVDWGTEELKQMLPVLKTRGAKVTFFVSGRWAAINKPLLLQIARDGHELATHGNNLKYGPVELARTGKLKGDISQSLQVIEGATNSKVRYYAPHMSEVNESILKTAGELGLRTVLYSLDTIDWMESTTPELFLKRMQRAMAGDLVLMHPKPNTAKALERALVDLQSRGLHAVTLTEMLSPEPEVPSIGWDHQHD